MKKRIMSGLLAVLMSVSLITGTSQSAAAANTQKSADGADIVNDTFWKDTDGENIYSQGGGIFKFGDTYYWYGVKYEEAEKYAKDPSVYYTKSDVFQGVTCYSSKDMVNWDYEGLVVTPEEVSGKEEMNGYDAVWVGRLGVAYMESTGQYALFVQHECDDPNNEIDGPGTVDDKWSKQVLVLTSDSPTGEFKWNQRINMKDYTGGTSNTGDQTVFTDEDTGKDYLLYSYGVGRGKMFLSEIVTQENGKVGLASSHQIYGGSGREGNCMFKYNGKYYVCASDLYGWNASHAYYLTLDSLEDDYLSSRPVSTKMDLMDGCSDDYCHVSQTGFFYTVKGSKQETVIFCGDRWSDFAGNGLGFNQWCPLSFDEKGTPYFNSLSAWNLDVQTGAWTVDDSNNYVKNGSFDADRISVSQMAGWTNTVTEGKEPISNGTNRVTGKYGLELGEATAFECKVSQTIADTPYVGLEDGVYTLSAKVKNTDGFDSLRMYAKSAGMITSYNIPGENANWTDIVLDNVVVSGGKVEVGFLADGEADAYCYVDDLSLVKTESENIKASGKIAGTVQADDGTKGKTLVVEVVSSTGNIAYTYETEITDNSQKFEIEKIPAGEYTVNASVKAAIVEGNDQKVSVSENQTTALNAFTVTNNAGIMNGKVTDKSGNALSGVKVTITKDDVSKDCVTGEDGTYTFADVDGGTYCMQFEKESFVTQTKTDVTVSVNETTTVDDVVMESAVGVIKGVVKDKYGLPDEGITVTLRGSDSWQDTKRYETTTDENGAYTFASAVAGKYQVLASKDGSVSAVAQNVELGRGEEKTVDLQIPVEVDKLVNADLETGNAEGWQGNPRIKKEGINKSWAVASWNSKSFSVDFYQTVTGLENGTYVVTVEMTAQPMSENDEYYLYAKNSNGDIISREDITDNSTKPAGKEWETFGLVAEVTDGTLTIGMKGSMSGGAWAKSDNFRLAQIKTVDLPVTEKGGLSEALDEAEKLSAADYTASSYEQYKEAIEKATAVLNNPRLEQSAVDQAVQDLEQAKTKLVSVKALNDFISENAGLKEEDFTKDTWAAYNAKLENAKQTAAKADASQAEINQAYLELLEARTLTVDISSAKMIAAAADSMIADSSIYTKDTVDALRAAQETLKTVLAKTNADKSEVEEAAHAVLNALSGLKPVPAENTNAVPVSQSAIALAQDQATIYTKGKKTVQLKAVVAGAAQAVAWQSSDPSVAEVNGNGLVTAKKAGTTVITASVNGVSAKCTVTVKKATLKLKKSSAKIKVGQKVTIKAKATPKAKITYKSSNKKIASVNTKGVVKGRKKGKAKITVKANGMKKTFKVTVK